jgi:hypothetical protein
LRSGTPVNITLFERPLLAGWIYPCTLEDIRERLAELPTEDLEGLWAVGLVPSTRKDCSVNGRYFGGDRPTIHLCSHQMSLTYKQPDQVKRSDLEHSQMVQLEYGMRIERVGSRWFCRWSPEDLRRFVVEHVLLHEVGHHVHHMQRRRQGFTSRLTLGVREQFAEDYALRHARRRRNR